MGSTYTIRIASDAERIQVAAILIKNGYTVTQRKKRKTSGTGYEYRLEISADDEKGAADGGNSI